MHSHFSNRWQEKPDLPMMNMPERPHRPEISHRPEIPHGPEIRHRSEIPHFPEVPHRPETPHRPEIKNRPLMPNSHERPNMPNPFASNRRRPPGGDIPLTNLFFRHGSLSLCMPFLGHGSKRDAIGLSVLLGMLEDPRQGSEVSNRFHQFMVELRKDGLESK